jgi:hypothetical protein
MDKFLPCCAPFWSFAIGCHLRTFDGVALGAHVQAGSTDEIEGGVVVSVVGKIVNSYQMFTSKGNSAVTAV